MGDHASRELLPLTTRIVSAHVAHNRIDAGEVSSLIRLVHGSLRNVARSGAETAPASARSPAVPIRQSIRRDHLVCLEDGRKLKMLKRYLMAQHGLTPDQYRERWGLPADYPMVAPASAERRRARGAQPA